VPGRTEGMQGGEGMKERIESGRSEEEERNKNKEK
jgi:hypothetical protein